MTTSVSKKLIDNAAVTSAAFTWPGGVGTFHVVGTFGGATVSLQRLGPDGLTWNDVGTQTNLTAPGMANFELGAGAIRAQVAGGTPSGLYASVASAF